MIPKLEQFKFVIWGRITKKYRTRIVIHFHSRLLFSKDFWEHRIQIWNSCFCWEQNVLDDYLVVTFCSNLIELLTSRPFFGMRKKIPKVDKWADKRFMTVSYHPRFFCFQLMSWIMSTRGGKLIRTGLEKELVLWS